MANLPETTSLKEAFSAWIEQTKKLIAAIKNFREAVFATLGAAAMSFAYEYENLWEMIGSLFDGE